MTDNKALPPLPFWQARSFWLAMATAGLIVADRLGFEVEGNAGAIADWVLAILPAVTALWAYLERRAPTMRIVLR